ncbi:MAG: hypothetical protein IT345_15815 [Trueperaceae bacterium]|nr:hypothetical protein [Trueperaceae bacterium]
MRKLTRRVVSTASDERVVNRCRAAASAEGAEDTGQPRSGEAFWHENAHLLPLMAISLVFR